MFAATVLTDEERAVDPHLGFPRGYAKLCRHAHVQAQGLISPYTEGPPQCFHPYAPKDEEITRFKGYDDLFPILDEEQRDVSNPRRHIDLLWQQLDHLGNAGFDPAIFRVDVYGNVLYWDADPGSPLAWDIDHWFPHARGGKSVPSNLKLVQWQACQRKRKKLEFLVPWWDLQAGVSVNQFLSVFASKDTNFRHRAFSFFFSSGENELFDNHKIVRGHSWPRHFRDRKNQVGLAAAGLVQVQKASEGALRSLNTNHRIAKQDYMPASLAGHYGDLQHLELQYFKDSNDKQSSRGQWHLDKENKMLSTGLDIANSAAQLEREKMWKQSIEEDKKDKMQESVRLEEELQVMKAQNVKEKVVLDRLEQVLDKQKKRVEKQRRWSETQSQYRLCLEKMIRDTLHQRAVYKEQARLNEAACDALLARLESQKSASDAAEMELLRKVKQREELEATARSKFTKRGREQGHTDVGSCLKPLDFKARKHIISDGVLKRIPLPESKKKTDDNEPEYPESKVHLHFERAHQQPHYIGTEELPESEAVKFDEQEQRVSCPKLLVRDKYSTKVQERQVKEASAIKCKENSAAEVFTGRPIEEGSERNMVLVQGVPGAKRKALEASYDLDVVLLGYEYQENEAAHLDTNREESVGDNGTTHMSILKNFSDDERDDAANKESHDKSDAYEESNNAENFSEKEAEGSEAGEIGTSEAEDEDEDEDEAEVGSSKAEDDGKAVVGILKTGGKNKSVQLFEKNGTPGSQAGETGTSEAEDEDEDEDEAEVGSSKAGDDGKAVVGILKTGGKNESVQLFEKNGTPGIEKTKDDEQLDELLQHVLAMQDKVNEAMVEAICEEENDEEVKRVGKLNLDKWLQKLLLDPGHDQSEEPIEREKRVAYLAGETRDFCMEIKKSNCLPVEGADAELVEAVRGGKVGGLWRKFSIKNGGSPAGADAGQHPKSGVSLNDIKKPGERRTSPWRWISPVSRRSLSAGAETRTRRLSPWRRNPKEDKTEERKMMESFSKLKLGGDKRQAETAETNGLQEGEMFDSSTMAREQGAFAKSKLRVQAAPVAQGMRERSVSTPPVKAQCGQLVVSPVPIRSNALITKAHPFASQAQRRKDYSGVSKDGGGSKRVVPSLGANGGAARKASMLKKTTSTRGGSWGSNGDGGPCVRSQFEEETEVPKANLFEDLDAQDGLRASLSLAWKKAVKKFEHG